MVVSYGETTDRGTYTEEFRQGAFARTIEQRGQRIPLHAGHVTADDNQRTLPIGMARTWEDTDDGLVGTFAVAPSVKGREALDLTRAGFIDGLSVGFISLRDHKTDTGPRGKHVVRVEAGLHHVGLVNVPSYDSARVLEARADDDHPFDPDSLTAAPRLSRWRALTGRRGYHPDKT